MGQRAAWSGSVAAFLDRPAGTPLESVLQEALGRVPGATAWWIVLDWRLLRRSRRVDAAIATDRAVVALQFRPGAAAFTAADRLAAEDAALDLAEFHAGSRCAPVLPVVLIPNGARPRPQLPLPLAGAAAAIEATRLTLPKLLAELARFPAIGLDPAAWAAAPYAPIPGLIEAAAMLYANHGDSRLRLAAAGPDAVCRTTAAIRASIAEAQAYAQKRVVFVTGAPGAGKTLCGLDLAFEPGVAASFLTGNPTLVHILREALVRDAVGRGMQRRAAQRRMQAVIQALPQFRDAHVAGDAPPPEHLLIIDEAQRCWSRDYAVRKTRNRTVKLTDSEPGHLLDIASRRPGWGVLVCLIGGGQEIHDGEGGLAAWGEALRIRPHWSVRAADRQTADPRQRLPALPNLRTVAELHLGAPIRAVRAPTAVDWVDAVLADDPVGAAAIARGAGGVPFVVTRSLAAMRAALRPSAARTAGLLASSAARRLRAEGLGSVLAHQDEDAVARWFLDRWPDIRSGDALEVVASEFAVQGLELDRAGLCWDGDLIRGASGWQARRFRANGWTRASGEARANRLNAYRVLLTRARHGTVIWVPQGSPRDPTRDPACYDAIAEYLLGCGAAALDGSRAVPEDGPPPEPALL